MSRAIFGALPLLRRSATLGLLAFGVGCGAGSDAGSGAVPTPVAVAPPAAARESTVVPDGAATTAPEPFALPRRGRPAVELMSATVEAAPVVSAKVVPSPAPAPTPAPTPTPAPVVTGTVRLTFAPTPAPVAPTAPTAADAADAVAPTATATVASSPPQDAGDDGAAFRRAVSLIGAPTLTTYGLGAGATKRTITQTTYPIVVLFPITARFSMDLSTAFASSEVSVGGAAVSTITGLTDTQLRGNYALGESMLITAGLNLPTGQYLIPASQQEAAGQIGNDFLNYGVSSMGTGFALTGGVAYARPIGSWNLGLGTSLRKATRFDAFEVDSAPFRFTPSDELRLRVGVDRPVGDGQIELGLSYSAFGVDVADTTTYSTGDRLIATAGWSFPVKGVRAYLSAWNLFRLAGEQLGGPAPGENVFNLAGGASFEVREILFQPTAELRLWQVDGIKAGNLVNLGVRARLGLGAFAVYPSVGFSTGTIFSTTDGTALSLSGYRGGLTIRWR